MNHRQSATILGLLAVLYAAALVLLAPQLDFIDQESGDEWLAAAAGGLLFAVPPFLAMWVVHGQARAAIRLPITTWLAVMAFLAATYGEIRNYGCGQGDFILLALVAWLTAYTALLIALWLLRAVRGWRLLRVERSSVSDVAHAHTEPAYADSQRQFTVRTILLWTAAAAVLCAALRWLAPFGSYNMDEWSMQMGQAELVEGAVLGLLVALAGLPVVAVAWIVLADGRRLVWRCSLAAITVAGMAGGVAAVSSWTFDADFPPLAWMIEAGALAAGLTAVSVVRACGYRLVRQKFAAIPSPLAGTPLGRRRRGQSRLVLATMASAGLLLALYSPWRFEYWRRADEIQRWLALGFNAGFDAAGRLNSIAYTGEAGKDLAGSEVLLTDLCDLKSLDLSNSLLTDAQLGQYPIHCPSMTQLESLNLAGTTIGDEALMHIDRFTNLSTLNLGRTKVTGVGLSRLSVLRQLKSLDLSDTSVLLEEISPLPQLEELNLEGTPVDDAALERLDRFPNLKKINLVRTEVTDDAVGSLSRLAGLRTIDLKLTAVSETGVRRLRRALPEAAIGTGANDATLKNAVTIERRTQIGHQLRIAVSTRLLKQLHARGNYHASETDGDSPAGVATTVTDTGLKCLASQTCLEELDLRDSAVTDAGLTSLAGLKSLKRLDLRGTHTTAGGCGTLAKALAGCEILR